MPDAGDLAISAPSRPDRVRAGAHRLGEAGPGVEILGRGGSARLRPLVLADGLAEIAPCMRRSNPATACCSTLPQRVCRLSANLRLTKNVPDLSILDDALRELAKAQMVVGAAAITSVALANGDVVVSVMTAPGAENLPYARIDRTSKRLQRIIPGSPLTGE